MRLVQPERRAERRAEAPVTNRPAPLGIAESARALRGARARAAVLLSLVGLGAVAASCGGKGGSSAGGSFVQKEWPADDKTLCEWKGKTDVEVTDTVGPGAYRPNVRRVFKITGDRDNRKLTLVCREADTNLDGLKDVARTYTAKGEPQQERADSNYDGKIDVWIAFVNGRIAEMEEDTNFDGKPDIWKAYSEGALARVRRDRNHDGKADLWEVYVRGKLERVGIDEDGDGAVDRWDRDLTVEQAAASSSEADGGAAAAATDGGTAGPTPTTSTPSTADAGADAGKR